MLQTCTKIFKWIFSFVGFKIFIDLTYTWDSFLNFKMVLLLLLLSLLLLLLVLLLMLLLRVICQFLEACQVFLSEVRQFYGDLVSERLKVDSIRAEIWK